MTALAVERPVDAALRDDLATVFGDDEWTTRDVGGQAPSGVWTTPAALLAGEHADGMSGLVELQRRQRPDVDPDLHWVTLLAGVCFPVIYTATKLTAALGRRPIIDPDDLVLRLELGDDHPGFRGVWFRRPRLQVIAGDALTGLDDVEVVADRDAMYRSLVNEAVSFLSPIVDTVRAHVSVGRRGLWGMALDSLLWPFSEQADDEPPTAAHARVERVLAAAHGTPFDRHLDWIEFEHAGRTRTELRTTSCCLAYKWPSSRESQRDDGCDPRWDSYCMLCPLIPKAESIYRARWWIDHPDGHE